MSTEKNFEIDEEELENTIGGKQVRRAGGPLQSERRTRRAGGQRGTPIRRTDDAEPHES